MQSPLIKVSSPASRKSTEKQPYALLAKNGRGSLPPPVEKELP
jgi:hypothetical protein